DGPYPTEWHEAIILPFLKSDKSGLHPQDYRPVALTNCICKLFERMINKRLIWLLETKNLLSPSQFGFRRGHSTSDPLTYLETYILSAFAQKHS
ncbi:reverse transcriptase domain-containing protein, partial [Escherichia coli]|uniref:reverse transcriptase domain-containing protein n=1 Tax=Escherichia coli TaxID=562 RepID=UPI00307A4359